MTENAHAVPKKQWCKWSDHQRAVFNGMFEDITNMGSDCFLHPQTVGRELSADEFSTIAWNAAWLAAGHAVAPGHITLVEAVDDAA